MADRLTRKDETVHERGASGASRLGRLALAAGALALALTACNDTGGGSVGTHNNQVPSSTNTPATPLHP